MEQVSKVLEELISLQRSYALTFRVITTEERYTNLIGSGLITEYTLDSKIIREPLLEHTGHLPVIAAFLHGKIKNKSKVDLGRVLIMLSIHDFGETFVGDVLTYRKNADHEKAEYEAVKQNLPNYLFKYFKEFEARETLDAKFAKAVDSIAPLLHEIALPWLTIQRLKHYNFNSKMIFDKKAKHFEFDPFLKKLFALIIKKFEKLEAKAVRNK